ncbi:acyl-CoA dehydrogenase family protein [Devosia sp. A369]
MDFAFTQEDDDLRQEVQTFLREYLTDDVVRELGGIRKEGEVGPLAQAFLDKIYEHGYSAITWPREYGGQARSEIAQFVIEEEFYRAADLRVGGGGSGGAAILASGSEGQKQYFLPKLAKREIVFAQGYSEPQCGTDLAGIKCRATRQGDKYVVNGQKIYTTHAHYATHIYLMVRTDPTSQRHQGLSILLIPMDTPGITVRPLWTIQNEPEAPPLTTYAEARTNEVFFENVEVPVSALLGEEGDGWAVAGRGLNLDRVGAWRYLISVMRDEDIVNWLNTTPAGLSRRSDPVVRDKVADLWIEAQVCRLMTMRSMSIAQSGGAFTYEGSAEKVFAPEHGVRSTEAISQILGPYAQLLSSSFAATEHGRFAHNLLGAFQSTVNHGSVHVMRDQIARKGFGMPRPARAQEK